MCGITQVLSARRTGGWGLDDKQMRELWGLLDRQRGRNEPDLRYVLSLAVEAGMQPTVDDALLLSLRLGNRGEWMCPAFISDFITRLARRRCAETVLDPWAGIGALLLTVASGLGKSRSLGIVSNQGLSTCAQSLAGGASIDWRVGHPLEILDDLAGPFDLVASCVPLGTPSQTIEMSGPHGVSTLHDEVGYLALAKACMQLGETGLGVFVVGHGFLSRAGKRSVYQSLDHLGLHLAAYINIPEGALRPFTGISTALVALQRQPSPDVFVGELTANQERGQALVDRFTGMRPSSDMATGVLIPARDLRQYRAMSSAQLASRLAHSQGLQGRPLSDVTEEVVLGSTLKQSNFQDKENAVYVPVLGHSVAVTSRADFTAKPSNYAQLVVRPEVADPRFFARYLNSPIGIAMRDGAMSGAFIPRISQAGLEDIVVYLPELSVQQVVVAMDEKLAGLTTEVDELRRSLWARPRSCSDLAHRLKKLNREDRFEDWLEELPFPLASVLWSFHAVEEDPKEQCERLGLYFEALAEFVATVFVSAFSTDPMLIAEEWTAIRRDLDEHHLSLERSSFGTWVTISARLSKAARTLLSGRPEDREMCLRLFRRSNPEPVEALCSPALISTLQAANTRRNLGAHGGASGDAEAEARLSVLSDLLGKSRRAMAAVWTDWQLVQPVSMKKRDGVYRVLALRVMGPWTPFKQCKLILAEDPETDRLCLLGDQESACLELLPFVRVMASPATAMNACYFFNREEGGRCRYVSYHFEQESEVTDLFPDAADALRRLRESEQGFGQ